MSVVVLTGLALTGLSLTGASTLATAEPFDAAGDVGTTSYASLPFESSVFQACGGCSPTLEPGNLFFQANPNSYFYNTKNMTATRNNIAKMEARGVVAAGGAQRWEETYEASFPAVTSPNEPAFVQTARNLGLPDMPEFAAWRNFITNHPQYWDMANDGGTMPSEPGDFRAWGGQWGHISPLTPLSVADCPPQMASCTWGDSYAYRWGQTAALSGGYGIMLADFVDSQPSRPSTKHNFNPLIVQAFASANHLIILGSTTGEQASWIVANAFNAWNDYLARGYGRFFQALATRLGAATSRQALVVDQCTGTPGGRRYYGTDERSFAQQMKPQNYLCLWDDHTIQSDRAGPIASPPMQELAGFVLAAAREPLMRNGANLEADDASYWSSIAKFYPSLSAADQNEVGTKLLKRLWTWSAWAHIADRSGNVRRALAFTSRDYWDNTGSLTALDPLTSLVQTIIPVRPFGPALYYSVAVERATETTLGQKAGAGVSVGAYLPAAHLQAFLDGGGNTGYYVSDAGLPRISKAAGNAPSAWVVLDAGANLPAAEQAQLSAIAPVVTSAAALAALPNQPLRFTQGLTGFGFYDQTNRLILVVSNPSTAATANAITGVVQLSGLPNGNMTLTNLFTGATSTITVTGGSASVPMSVSRWDTLVLSLT